MSNVVTINVINIAPHVSAPHTFSASVSIGSYESDIIGQMNDAENETFDKLLSDIAKRVENELRESLQ